MVPQLFDSKYFLICIRVFSTMNLDIYNGPSYYDYETAKAHPHTSFYVYDLYNDIKYYYNGTGYNKKYHKEGVDNK